MSVKDCPGIDRPIVPVLDKLNALGFETSWSCCGYNYRGQGKKKDHEAAHVRVECSQSLIDELLDVMERGWWRIEYLGGNLWAFWATSRLPSDDAGGISCERGTHPQMVKDCWAILENDLDKLHRQSK